MTLVARIHLIVALATLLGVSLIVAIVSIYEGHAPRAICWPLALTGMSGLFFWAGVESTKKETNV